MDQDRQPEGTDIPEFDLPPWGSGGAPAYAEPPAPEPAGDRRPVVVTVDRLEGRSRALGLVSGEGSHEATGDDHPASAVSAARTAALERLMEEAASMGASGVVGTRFAVSVSKRRATVLASGTAVV